MADDNLLDHVADIVSAHVSHNSVAMSDLAGLIQSVHHALSTLGLPVTPVEEVRTPAVSIRASIKPEALTCLDCGAKMKMLKRHISTDHGLTPSAYRERWNLPAGYPMVAADYSAKRKALALSFGLGRKAGQTVRPAAKPAPKAKPAAAKKPLKQPAAGAPAAEIEVPATVPEAQATPAEA